jgi:hypothetical protein
MAVSNVGVKRGVQLIPPVHARQGGGPKVRHTDNKRPGTFRVDQANKFSRNH